MDDFNAPLPHSPVGYGTARTRGGTRNRSLDEDIIQIEPADDVDIPPPLTPRSHKRGRSESQNLLPRTRTKSPVRGVELKYEAKKSMRWDHPEVEFVERARGRASPMWSGVPQYLKKTTKEKWWELGVDVVSLLSALPFFALVGAVVWVNGKEVEPRREGIFEQCIKVGATIFPLVFSVIVGRAMLKIAEWKLERGASLGLFETLVGSRTVGGTIITQFRLSPGILISIGLIVLWLLSPVGSQAILRMLSTQSTSFETPGNFTYLNTRQASYSGTPIFNSWISGFTTLFNAALLASQQVKNSRMDSWGNVKVPYLSSLSGIPEDENGWQQIPQNTSTLTYSSLFGIPISGILPGTTTFNLESSHIELTCANITSNLTRGSFRDFDFDFYNPGDISTKGPFFSAQNITKYTPWAIGYLGEDISSLSGTTPQSGTSLDSLPSNTTRESFMPGLLLYQDFTGSHNVTSIYCTPYQSYVESEIICTLNSTSAKPSCTVSKQRLSLLPHMPSTLTPLSFLTTFLGMSAVLPNTTREENHISMLQNYIFNPNSNAFIQSALWPAYTNSTTAQGGESRFLNVSLPDFEARLGQIINAYLIGTFQNSTSYLTSDFSLPSTPLFDTPQSLSTSINSLPPSLTVPSTLTALHPTFQVSYPWLSLLLFSTLILLVSIITSAILSRLTLHRPYLSYISSLLRESEYTSFPHGGVGLDGMERSKGMKHLKVRIGDLGDVEGGHEVGTGVVIGVGMLGVGRDERVRGVEGGRLYV